jgi:hypothetical protein
MEIIKDVKVEVKEIVLRSDVFNEKGASFGSWETYIPWWTFCSAEIGEEFNSEKPIMVYKPDNEILVRESITIMENSEEHISILHKKEKIANFGDRRYRRTEKSVKIMKSDGAEMIEPQLVGYMEGWDS